MVHTTVHLVRHGEVHNPEGILYGRLPGYRLSDRGQAMAARLAEFFGSPERDIKALVCSPLERAQQTMAPIAAALGLDVRTDDRVIEASNYFEGMTFGVGDGSLRHPRHWPRLINPTRPSWGEPYKEQVARMHAAVADARNEAAGGEAVIVSHQLPVWIARLAFEGKRLWHDPRKRECSLASVTSIHFDDDELTSISYAEPAGDLLKGASQIPGA